MFGKICGYVITGATAVMMAGAAALTTLWVKDEIKKQKKMDDLEKSLDKVLKKED